MNCRHGSKKNCKYTYVGKRILIFWLTSMLCHFIFTRFSNLNGIGMNSNPVWHRLTIWVILLWDGVRKRNSLGLRRNRGVVGGTIKLKTFMMVLLNYMKPPRDDGRIVLWKKYLTSGYCCYSHCNSESSAYFDWVYRYGLFDHFRLTDRKIG